ncbi:hypothetical protein NMG60_11023755 [Bertholletia excelsa]
MDLRHLVAGLLTLSMFMMLGNMIKKDHFDSVTLPATSLVQYDSINVSKQSVVTISGVSKEPWKEDEEAFKPCWKKPPSERAVQSKGFIIFSLTGGPEYHVLQIANGVAVARHLGATLVLPDIRGSNSVRKRNFGEVYDVKKFVKSLDGLVRISTDQPPEGLPRKITTVRIPGRVSEAYIAKIIEPLLKISGALKLKTLFPSSKMVIKEENVEHLDSLSCLVMFEMLELQKGLREVMELMVERLRSLSLKSTNGKFIAVDLRVGYLGKESEESEGSGMSWCYNPREIGEFLKMGFHRNTTIYLTQSRWNDSLDALGHCYPNMYTKEDIMASR